MSKGDGYEKKNSILERRNDIQFTVFDHFDLFDAGAINQLIHGVKLDKLSFVN